MKKTLNLHGKLFDLSAPVIMGILNITPDSFHNGSRVPTLGDALNRAEQMLAEGAKILDVGGYSTRPNATDISPDEELKRVLPVIEALNKYFSEAVISIDTFRSSVAKACIEAGAHIINDVSGGNIDAAMFDTVAALEVPYIMMHSRGTPQTMSQLTAYDDLVPNVIQELQIKIQQLRERGIKDIVIDPGFGFAKTVVQNFALFAQLNALKTLDLPILVGVSRKSMIWRTLDTNPDKALNGTTVLNTIALQKGADIIRVHDVREAVEVVRLLEKISTIES